MSILKVGPADFEPQLVIFDKDGTLIDFDAMWGGWLVDLAGRLERLCARPIREPLFAALGYDAARGRALADGLLAVTPMAELYQLTADLLREQGLSGSEAATALGQAWHIPDPVALARPFTPLPGLFGRLRAGGLRVAVATTDDRAPTEATLRGLGAAGLVDALICADDGVRVKPAPDMVAMLCARLNVPAGRAVMVGDSLADLQMGRAARVGLVVGVLSGVSPAEVLAPEADILLDSVAGLV